MSDTRVPRSSGDVSTEHSRLADSDSVSSSLPALHGGDRALQNVEQSDCSDEEEWQRTAAQPPPAVTQIMLPSPDCTAGGTAPSSPMETTHSPLSKPEEPDSVPPKKRKRQGELCVRYQNQKRMKQVSKKWGTGQRWIAVGTYPKHQKKAQQQKHPPQKQKTRRRRPPKEVIWDIYAGSQTLGKLRRTSNIVYVPFDIRPTVWSAIHKAWVENVEFNRQPLQFSKIKHSKNPGLKYGKLICSMNCGVEKSLIFIRNCIELKKKITF